tara:strand:+ start:531 stop:902 length:372 start_codon:yes stop_codon:yes gene_type:complete
MKIRMNYSLSGLMSAPTNIPKNDSVASQLKAWRNFRGISSPKYQGIRKVLTKASKHKVCTKLRPNNQFLKFHIICFISKVKQILKLISIFYGEHQCPKAIGSCTLLGVSGIARSKVMLSRKTL